MSVEVGSPAHELLERSNRLGTDPHDHGRRRRQHVGKALTRAWSGDRIVPVDAGVAAAFLR
jgi:hypothetical protein